VPLKDYSALAAADARAALRMIREVVEQNAPPGSVPAEEYVEPPFTKEAEALVEGSWQSLRRKAEANSQTCGSHFGKADGCARGSAT